MEYKYPPFGKAAGKVNKSLQSCETIGQCESVLTMVKNLYPAYPEREEEIYEMINVVVGQLGIIANRDGKQQKQKTD